MNVYGSMTEGFQYYLRHYYNLLSMHYQLIKKYFKHPFAYDLHLHSKLYANF